MIMSIFSKKGDRVRFANPDYGYTHDQELCREHLKLGEVYTIFRCRVYGSSTSVELEEVPGHIFNSVMFEDA